MKFLICILAICSLLHPILGENYLALGISKPTSVVVAEFADSINKIIGSVGYIQFYDVVGSVSMAIVKLDLTLSSIEMKDLHIVQKMDPAQLEFTVDNGVGTIKSKAAALSLGATLALKWSYKSGNKVVYSGTYQATLATSKPDVSFTLTSADSKGKIAFGWALSNVVITGFGGLELVKTQVAELIASKLYPVFNEELNRYNDIIVSSTVYSYFYRSIPLPLSETETVNMTMKNSLNKFSFTVDGDKKRLNTVFSSSVYLPILHTSLPLDAASAPTEATEEDKIAVHVGAASMAILLGEVAKSVKSLKICPHIQKEVFGYELSVGLLAAFYPKLSEEYDPKSRIILFCNATGFSATEGTFTVACRFVLKESQTTVLMTIEKIVWSGSFFLGADSDEATNKNVRTGLESFRLSDLKIKYPLVPSYVSKQLMGFLQPISIVVENLFRINFPVVGNDMSWSLTGTASNTAGDLSLFYARN